jgi:hypothetical protein
MKKFVIIIDNEVVKNVEFPEAIDNVPEELLPQFEEAIAIFSSDPRYILVDEPVEIGLIWDGQNFNSPVE